MANLFKFQVSSLLLRPHPGVLCNMTPGAVAVEGWLRDRARGKMDALGSERSSASRHLAGNRKCCARAAILDSEEATSCLCDDACRNK